MNRNMDIKERSNKNNGEMQKWVSSDQWLDTEYLLHGVGYYLKS
jgi:hypothetical protein